MKCYLQTGQQTCHDIKGYVISCAGSGQDAEFRKGDPWPDPRFKQQGDIVLDCLTGLQWAHDANIAEFPMTWQEALNYIHAMNQMQAFGCDDWRLPNRRELRSLMSYQTKRPALPESHPFRNVVSGWYWTSSTAAINPAYAWYVHMEGARMFYGNKKQYYLLWPVRGKGYGMLPATGQTKCFDSDGNLIPCAGTGQDGEFRLGQPWPSKRFKVQDDAVMDNLTGLCWLKRADLTGKLVTWGGALKSVAELNLNSGGTCRWRLPNINELESLVDCGSYNPALPAGFPFEEVQEAYWSSTTSMFEPDWAWGIYLKKGAVGVGQKLGTHFHVWPVCDVGLHYL